MTEKIILSIISIIMLVLTLKKGDKRTICLTLGLTIGILLTWTRVPVIITIGIFTYMLTALMIAMTSLRSKELTKLNQVTIGLSGMWPLERIFFQ